jgi:hypothetical protein
MKQNKCHSIFMQQKQKIFPARFSGYAGNLSISVKCLTWLLPSGSALPDGARAVIYKGATYGEWWKNEELDR